MTRFIKSCIFSTHIYFWRMEISLEISEHKRVYSCDSCATFEIRSLWYFDYSMACSNNFQRFCIVFPTSDNNNNNQTKRIGLFSLVRRMGSMKDVIQLWFHYCYLRLWQSQVNLSKTFFLSRLFFSFMENHGILMKIIDNNYFLCCLVCADPPYQFTFFLRKNQTKQWFRLFECHKMRLNFSHWKSISIVWVSGAFDSFFSSSF